MKIVLSESNSWKWINYNNVFYACGYAYYSGHLYRSKEMYGLFENIGCIEDFIRIISNFNGNYAIIMRFFNEWIISVDHIRSIPLFISKEDNEICVFDSACLYNGKRTISEDCVSEFLATGYVTGNQTLFNEITQIEAGQWIKVSNDYISEYGYHHSYEYCDFTDETDSTLLNRIDESYRKMTNRLITLLDNRTAVIPLSGGHDSRLLAYYLHEAGYNKIVAYTYGRENNGEAIVSRKVAEYLGIDWYFIPYKSRELSGLFYDKEKYRKMAEKCANSCTVPLIQEWFAIDYLINHGIIDNNCIIVPGYSNDMLNGSHIIDAHLSIDNLEQKIVDDHYCLWDWKNSRNSEKYNTLFTGKVKYLHALNDICHMPRNVITDDLEKNERFDYYERQVKHIINAVRIYELYGLKWLLPFWDCDIINFWLSIPLEKREGRKLFYKFTEYKYPELMHYAPVYESRFTQMKKKLPNKRILLKSAYLAKFIIVALTGRRRDKLNYYGYLSFAEYWQNIIKYRTVNYYYMFSKHYINFLLKHYDISK